MTYARMGDIAFGVLPRAYLYCGGGSGGGQRTWTTGTEVQWSNSMQGGGGVPLFAWLSHQSLCERLTPFRGLQRLILVTAIL